ncbi:MAG: type-F conjugative transfer system pilin assembly protein TrbC [Alphaproteobacteria bacterium]|jgi:type-F conjugative transfer system pilin assembly protein TrbC
MLPALVFLLLCEICIASETEVSSLIEKSTAICKEARQGAHDLSKQSLHQAQALSTNDLKSVTEIAQSAGVARDADGMNARVQTFSNSASTEAVRKKEDVKNFLGGNANGYLLKDDPFLMTQKKSKPACTSCGKEDSQKIQENPSSFVFQEIVKKDTTPLHEKSKEENQLLVFVSFSMGDEMIRTLFEDAVKKGARVLIRGLIENSWQKTLEKLKKIQANVDIDPEAFKRFEVTVVPTFVLVHKKGFSSLQGSVSLSYASKALLQEGNA